MAPLATLDDVKRILRVTGTDADRDAQLTGALEAVESWAEERVKYVPITDDDDVDVVETYFDIYEDATIQLPTSDCTVTAVKVFEYPSSNGIPLSPVQLGLGHGYDVDGDNLILRPTLGFSPFEGVSAQRRLRAYSRIEVSYRATGTVPAAVRDGIAFLAAGVWQDGPRALAGLTSEKIGDYSYTVGSGAPGDPASYVTQAMFFLHTFLRRSRISVT